MTGKAAGSAGVCTTDTCLDSITGLGSHSFLPIKTEKTDPLRPTPLRKSTRASPPTSSSPTLPAVSVTASSHPMPPSTTLCSPHLLLLLLRYGHPSYRVLKIRLRSRRTRSRTGRGLADAFYSFISSVIHLFPIRDLDRRSQKCECSLVEAFRYLVTVTINVWLNNTR